MTEIISQEECQHRFMPFTELSIDDDKAYVIICFKCGKTAIEKPQQ